MHESVPPDQTPLSVPLKDSHESHASDFDEMQAVSGPAAGLEPSQPSVAKEKLEKVRTKMISSFFISLAPGGAGSVNKLDFVGEAFYELDQYASYESSGD